MLRLASEDQMRFANTLIDLPASNARLKRAQNAMPTGSLSGECKVCNRGAFQGPSAYAAMNE
ncbi:hypothetical protein [Pelagibacterium sp. H642]|uniref:hypothetical protein n=1 Tax=Pelagibacterium sp. H642 TaxID=1881069 RepID=UPI002815B6E8|nr:hypothetical protein [Pelagibacterium sp. H642]WMT92521.1 hypothetical protein NO934_19395 [Pelagibacterium sp. H642]